MAFDFTLPEPSDVFGYFTELCAFPHGSGNTSAVTAWLIRFAMENRLSYETDEIGNVLIRKPGSGANRSSAPVLLQGHIDMVAVKEEGSDHDFTKDPLDLFLDGDLLGARGTTLGGDDGIAVAFMLAILAGKGLSHPPVEALFTVDEETGMYGAAALDPSWINAKRMINLDSEKEGVFTIGCAGGINVTASFKTERVPVDGMSARILIAGLTGGHSGEEIAKPLASAVKLLARTLRMLRGAYDFRICSLWSGEKHNAIPVAAYADILIREGDFEQISAYLGGYQETLRREYAGTDDGIRLSIELTEKTQEPICPQDADRLLGYLLCVPQGVEKMSGILPGAVETSSNVGILRTDGDTVNVYSMLRSSVISGRDMLTDRIRMMAEAFGGTAEPDSPFPAWEANADSSLLSLMKEVYLAKYGKEPVVSVTHGGLECGIISEKIPGIEIVSLGPDMIGIHTAAERLSVSSSARTYDFLTAVLAAL